MNEARSKGGKPTMSWLVRCWEEPREESLENPVFRCSVRDLRTGEERYLSDPREIGELMLRQIRTERREAGQREDKAGNLRRSG